jgi:hypothetical protein
VTTSQPRHRFGLLFAVSFAFLSAVPIGASEAQSTASACKQEIQRVAVWPKGGNPKAAQVARFENREVTVCNGKVVSQKPQRNASTAEPGTR